MNFALIGTAFGVVFVAELPDKTALASLALGARYRSGYVFAGVAAAFAAHVVLAVTAGGLLGLLPRRPVEAVVAALFALGAIFLLRQREEEPAPPDQPPPEQPPVGQPPTGQPPAGRSGFWPVATRSFVVLFVAEFGDLTQIAMANLAARYHDPLAVGIGAVLGLWAVAGLAITGGRQLLRLIPYRWITRIAAAVMAALAVVTLISAIAGLAGQRAHALFSQVRYDLGRSAEICVLVQHGQVMVQGRHDHEIVGH
jgi:Ca2+/H+ antiporter, TMEM165/GDT1 family